jgi:hypothetical protein
MIPNVFISSTIADLQYMRDAARDVIVDLALKPIMSEHGEVAYLFDATAEASCYAAIQQCQVAVVIVGKRYGARGKNDLSITHNEYRAAREQSIPIFSLIDREVLSFKRVSDANKAGTPLSFPGMEDAESVFAFVQEIADFPRNNALLQFDSVPAARAQLRLQFAHLLGDLLSRHADPVKGDVRDILSEVKALRHALADTPETRQLVRGIRLLLEDHLRPYGELIDQLGRPPEDTLPLIIRQPTLETAVQAATGKPLAIFEPGPEVAKTNSIDGVPLRYMSVRSNRSTEDPKVAIAAVTVDNTIHMNGVARELFGQLHMDLLKEATSEESVRLSHPRLTRHWS